MFNAIALRHAMLDAHCSMVELAKVCGISPSALYRRVRGSTSFKLGEVNHCVERLNLTREQRNEIFFGE